MNDNEYHVASFVVRTRPEDGAATAAKISSVPGLEVHAEEDGKLVVTAEAGSERRLAVLARDIEEVNTVMAVAPVYHEFSDDGR